MAIILLIYERLNLIFDRPSLKESKCLSSKRVLLIPANLCSCTQRHTREIIRAACLCRVKSNALRETQSKHNMQIQDWYLNQCSEVSELEIEYWTTLMPNTALLLTKKKSWKCKDVNSNNSLAITMNGQTSTLKVCLLYYYLYKETFVIIQQLLSIFNRDCLATALGVGKC